ncbi:MAG: tRNA uridine-5-carboxymethylaminomethyl(34) synthesis GTPase MnmE [Proteobacteria bacterium]|nr:tRNA uridine-5-carboxymethylaminomethyl(34) synthesis GTPase MnmE [Pseudomonadota bacterium]MBU1596794.1 tRNA uridine-5-carboxymethylaminomethyl(34) synthesis GTPase MnmE [Pseudomonadota bacterium]
MSPPGTIAAIATAAGPGAVGILRLSGPQALPLAASLFRSPHAGFTGLRPRRLHHGSLVDATGRVLDEVLAAYMPGPGSFTGEDVVELFCHGGPAVLRAVLDELLAGGARLARPGEFTLRAFLNGRLDLTQAEAVAETIAAPTRAALHLAQMKLSGALSGRIRAVREALESLRGRLCLAVDFPDEDVDCLPLPVLRQEALAAAQDVGRLLAAVARTRAWREGALAVLAGLPNAGKSSLLNALTGRRRAIVSDRPGTTRDYLEESIDLDGLVARLADTAGLPQGDATRCPVEAQGQVMSCELMERAEAVLYVVDSTRPLSEADRGNLAGLAAARTLVLLNKADLPASEPSLAAELAAQGFQALRVSARTGEGLEEASGLLRSVLTAGRAEPDADEVAPNARQAEVLRRAREELLALAEEVQACLPYDILGQRLDGACRLLAELTGEIAPDEVLEQIFSRFCIGK